MPCRSRLDPRCRGSALARALLVAAATCTATAVAAEDPIRLAVTEFSSPNPKFELFRATQEAIRKAVAPRRVEFLQLPIDQLEAAVRSRHVDILLTGAGFYRRNVGLGLRDIATAISPQQPNPDKSVGSVFIARQDRSDIKGIADLKNRSIATTFPGAFHGEHIPFGEIERLGFDSRRFFSELRHYGVEMDRIVEAVQRGEVDAGIVRACHFEDSQARTPGAYADLKILDGRQDLMINCITSTALYPNWSVLVTPTLTPQEVRHIVAALLEMPPTTLGLAWGVASDFGPVDELLRTLAIGPYTYLREWTLRRLLTEYWQWFFFAGLMVLAGLYHSFELSRQVKRRTTELNAAYERQTALSNAASRSARQLDALQRASAVQQLSSLVAHELAQPLSTLVCYTRGLRRVVGRGATAVPGEVEAIAARIEAAAEKADSIIQKVREFARRRPPSFTSLELGPSLRRAVEHLRLANADASIRSADIQVECPAGIRIEADPLELELVTVNLVRNAVEAFLDSGEAASDCRVKIRVQPNDTTVLIEFLSNSPPIDADTFSQLGRPTLSAKSDGLGLGLSIVMAIVERHAAQIDFNRSDSGSLCVRIGFPH